LYPSPGPALCRSPESIRKIEELEPRLAGGRKILKAKGLEKCVFCY
jgi:hypothetical protein